MKARFKQDNEPISDAVYWRINLSKVKNRPYIISLDEYESVGTQRISFVCEC